MKNRTKINAKSKLGKVMPKWCQYDRKWVQNRAQIDAQIDEKTHAKNRSKKYGENFRKIVGRSGQNSKKADTLSPEGRTQGIFWSARRNKWGRRGGKEGLKPLRVWLGSWARSLDPGIWGLEIWDLAKPDGNLI